MKYLVKLGRFFFAIAITAFGIQHFIYAITGAGLGPPWTPVNHLLAYPIGAALIAAGVGIATGIQVRCAGIMLASVVVVRALLCYAPKLAANVRDPGPWTSAFEILAMGGASLVLAATYTTWRSRTDRTGGRPSAWFQVGKMLFAVALIVFGIQHFLYATFIATLITPWIPGHLFWAYFVGVAFVASALAIASGILAPLAATLLGTMFFLWVVMLHAPRVVAALHNANEWTSMLVALAMSGGAFIVAGTLAGRD
jgi:uncharacterized membrane protein